MLLGNMGKGYPFLAALNGMNLMVRDFYGKKGNEMGMPRLQDALRKNNNVECMN